MAEKKSSNPKPTSQPSKLESDRQMLAEAREQGLASTLGTYVKMSGPGWLQSAITLGGGSLASSLYLGVIAGYSMMWVQPLAMILGIIMLSAIGYVTVVTGERPFRAINEHVNPVLGWGWALAVFAANIVWCLPQYALAQAAVSQNLLPGLFDDKEGKIAQWAATTFSENEFFREHMDEIVFVVPVLLLATFVTWSYDRGGRGLKIFETILKIMVGLIVISFIAVIFQLSFFAEQGLPWGSIAAGFWPDFSSFFTPAETFNQLLDDIGPAGDATRKIWSDYIVDQQQDVIISAAATAVGINMTFLFAYSLLRKGWTREFSGLIKFDLATGMLIPFILATSCVVIASASRFHTEVPEGFSREPGTNRVNVPESALKSYDEIMAACGREHHEASGAEKELAVRLVRRDAGKLAQSLRPVTGDFFANYIFGFGVLAMTFSTITILMLISGFVFTELLGLPPGGWPHRFGTLLAGVGGSFGPIVWQGAKAYLAVPTSVFGYVLLPLAYLTFFLLMNQKSILGDDRPRGLGRLMWNLLMSLSVAAATLGSVYMAHKKAGWNGIGAIAAFTLLVILSHFYRVNTKKYDEAAQQI
ncbi:MAG: hypothetical protein DWQ31_13235 [Planctomycetota bacterium]|nr:MAG: hypothetical protein DWQ31_13235 [Planctomycetota bacterium]REJ87099.1 MAG: hypothetical protein DWQ35_22115 [Planctomycetota bacterium]REK26983.1 MAG: hypothetical protein DWQ42_07960 [Planctomycetota bacterium]REK47290.1 MAG: hypothetical protein DWQ46_04650 [Planctomycetota bacterium]